MRGEPNSVKQLLQKAKDSALLAVEFYNKPAVSFKSEGYITMMCIAWTSLFHAYFLKNKIRPYYRKKSNVSKRPRFEQVIEKLADGKVIKNYRWWELQECVKQYFKNDSNSPVKKNLEFFVPLRNMIVHRNLPELDDSIFGECQALLINFNNFIELHFDKKYSIKNSLSFSLQLIQSPRNFIEASKDELKKIDAAKIIEFIKSYRSSLTTEQFESPEYSFKAVLIQVKNHESKDTLALKFINEKDLNNEQKEQLKNIGIVLVKEKQTKIDGVPENYSLTYDALVNELKKEIPSLKLNKEFHDHKNQILQNEPNLKHTRKLDPNNPKSPKKDYYDPQIIDKFKKYYT
ncbi:MAG: hypothetical protein Fur0027_19870 [Raineya sp.]